MAGKGTRADFVEWLRSKKPREVVGWSCGAQHPNELEAGPATPFSQFCPLGTYARERGLSRAVSGKWQRVFAEAVDGGWDDDFYERPTERVTARKCLQLLGEDV